MVYRLDSQGIGIQFTASILALTAYHPPVQYTGALSLRVKLKLATHLHLMLKLRTVELYLHSLINLHGVRLNYAQRRLYFSYLFIEGDLSQLGD
jgi:hypothetical protein